MQYILSMIGTIYITGVIGIDTTLLDVIKQAKALSSSNELLVKIDSVGGYVDAGKSIYDFLKNLEKPVTTYTTQAYSIASMIFMAGEKRIIPQGAEKALMIHLPWMQAEGNHKMLLESANQLKIVENELVKFYSEAISIDADSIQSLLKSETFLSAEQSLELGFATELRQPQNAVALLNTNNKEEKEQESLMNKLSKKIDAIFNQVMGIKAELILQDATGLELVFPDLAEGDLPEVDSKTTVDGKAAEGEFLMPDGSKIIVTAGAVTEIQPVAEDEISEDETVAVEGDEVPTEEAPEADDKDAIIEELQAKIAELEAKLSDTEVQDKMVAIIEKSVEKANEMEAKFQALAKQIGSDFNPSTTKENQPNVKAKADAPTSRAWQILNS